MNLISKIVGSVLLTLALGVVGLAGEMMGPPCSPPDPGQTQTPPCVSSQQATDDSIAPGQTSTPPSANTFDLGSVVADVITAFVLF